jgi:hypothetical protein
MKRRRRVKGKCEFCGKRTDEKLEYIYPVPWPNHPGQVKDNLIGKYACPRCAAEQRQLQVDLGLVDPNGSNLYKKIL